MFKRATFSITVVLLGWGSALAGGRILDGAPLSSNNAQKWCIAQLGNVPNWDGPADPECKMVWRVLAERNGRTLYSARYAWPSRVRSKEPLRVLTEVLYEGVAGSRVVRRLYAIQEDEAHVRLEPLRVLKIGGVPVIESRVCMSDTGECGRELTAWAHDLVEPIEDYTVTDIRSRLPKGYDLKMNPNLDLAAMSGSGKAWARGDADCCPTGAIEFTLRLDGRELHVEDLQFERLPS